MSRTRVWLIHGRIYLARETRRISDVRGTVSRAILCSESVNCHPRNWSFACSRKYHIVSKRYSVHSKRTIRSRTWNPRGMLRTLVGKSPLTSIKSKQRESFAGAIVMIYRSSTKRFRAIDEKKKRERENRLFRVQVPSARWIAADFARPSHFA